MSCCRCRDCLRRERARENDFSQFRVGDTVRVTMSQVFAGRVATVTAIDTRGWVKLDVLPEGLDFVPAAVVHAKGGQS